MYQIPSDIQYRPGQYLRFADVGGRFIGVEYSVTSSRGVWFRVLEDMSLERVGT